MLVLKVIIKLVIMEISEMLKQEDLVRAIEDTIGVPLPTMRTKQAYSQYISENINAYKREKQRWHGIDDYNWENEILNG